MERGITVSILVEKSRSVGGRLATRRIGEGKADHGAQFFTVRSPELEKGVESWLQEGWVRRWFGDSHPRYTGTEGMNALAKNLATGLTVRLNTKVLLIIGQCIAAIGMAIVFHQDASTGGTDIIAMILNKYVRITRRLSGNLVVRYCSYAFSSTNCSL